METEKLEKCIREMDSFDEELIRQNLPESVTETITRLLAEKGINRAVLIKRLNLDRTYGYQMLNGTRAPTRKHLIKIALLLKLPLEQLQELLRSGGKEILYVRNMTDAKTVYAVEHKLEYEQAAEFIWGVEEEL